jgi:tape measure domain-containing protein
MAGVGTPGTAPASAPAGPSSGGSVIPPTLQALTVALGQAAATVGTAGQVLGQTMQAAGVATAAFTQSAQRAAAVLQTTTGRPVPAAAAGGGGRGGGIFGGATIGAAAGGVGGFGGAANAAQNIARQSQAAAAAAQRSSSTISSAFEKMHNSISGVTERVMSLRTAFIALGAGVALRSLAETGMQFESLTKAMNVVTGDSAVAKQEMARLREETDRLGLVTSSVADDYLRFLASIKGSSIDANAAKDAFFGVAQAMSLLGKGEEQTNRALKAIEQIASKGQVYAEELKQQLGDQLPGAINTAATAMGYTVERMFQEMEKGTVSAEEFFAVFNKELQIRFPVDRMDSARASVNRLTNAWVDFQNLMANSGFLDSWADAADRLAEKMNSIEGRVLAQEIGEVLGKAIRATADAMIWLADNADKVKIALLSIIGIQIVGFLTGVAGAALKTAGAFKVLWAAAGMSGLGRIARGVGAVAGALGLGAAAAGLFGDETGDVSSQIQGAENAIDSYYEKLKSGKSATDDMTEAQRDLAIEMTKTAIAAEQSKLDKMQGERKQLLDMVAPERPPEWKEEALGHTLNLDKPEFSGNEIAMEFNRIGEEADKVAGNVEKLSEKLKFLEDDAAIAARQKPKQPEQRKDLLPPLPKGGSRGGGGAGSGKRSTESYFEEQKAELDAQIQAEQSITAAYGQGAEAVEKQRRELEILRKVQKLKFEFNPKQVAELEQRIRALADATDQTAFKGSGAAIDEETQKIQRLAEARAESGQALSQQEAQEQARSEAASKGILHVAGAVETLTAKYMEQARARDEASNVEAAEGYENEVQAIERMIGAMDLEGIARTRRIAELQEEARMIQENIDLNSASARARIEAAGAVAVADMSAGVRRESEELKNQITTTAELSGAMAVYGEQRIREMAEIEMRNNLLARGADMTDANTEATIRFAGESAVLTNRLERQNDALDQLANSGLTFNEQMRSISADGLGHMEDALVDIITGTKSVREAFADMARSIAADLARMAVRQAITIPIAMAMNSMFMGPAAMAGGGMGMAATGMPMPLYHTGGIVGKETPMVRTVDPGIFAAAPRFHAGTPDKLPKLASNEMPAVLKKDEGVFTPAQMQALGPAGGNQTVVVSPTINVNQPAGATEEQGQRFGKGIMRELQGLVDDRISRAFKPGGIRNQTGMAG